ncbi:MAG: tetratricopeptide repeat protein, partial [Bacilli bacterium]
MNDWAQLDEELEQLSESPVYADDIKDKLLVLVRTEPTEAAKRLIRMRDIADEHLYMKPKAWSLAILGLYELDRTKYEDSVHCLLEAKNIFEFIGDTRGELFCCNLLLGCYNEAGVHEVAVEWGLKGMRLAERVQDDYALSLLLVNMAITYVKLELIEEAKQALSQYNQLLPFLPERSDESIIVTHQIESEILIYEGDYDEAYEKLQEIELLTKRFPIHYTAQIRLEATIYDRTGRIQEALSRYEEGIRFCSEIQGKENQCAMMKQYGELLVRIGRDDAIDKLEEAIRLATEIDSRRYLIGLYQTLADVYRARGQYKEAFEQFEKYERLKTQVYVKNHHLIINEVQKKQLDI